MAIFYHIQNTSDVLKVGVAFSETTWDPEGSQNKRFTSPFHDFGVLKTQVVLPEKKT